MTKKLSRLEKLHHLSKDHEHIKKLWIKVKDMKYVPFFFYLKLSPQPNPTSSHPENL